MPRPLKVAIVGTGMIAAVHRRSVMITGSEIVGVLGSSPDRSDEAASAWGVPTAYRDLDQLLSSDADVVHVCTPNASHAAYALAALEAGKHVVCEKPLGISVAEAAALAEAAERAGVVATVPFVYRYHPLVREIRSRVQAGEFGAWNLIHGHYLQDWLRDPASSNWRVDPSLGGESRAFADIGSHWCDLVEFVTGSRFGSLVAHRTQALPKRVAGHARSFGGPSAGELVEVRTEDVATVMLLTCDDVPATLVVSQVATGRKNRLWFEVDGEHASASFDQENPESAWFADAGGTHRLLRDPASGSDEQRRLSFLPAGHPQGYADCFAAFVADTYSAVRGGEVDGLPTFLDGLRSAHIVEAVLRSAETASWTEVQG